MPDDDAFEASRHQETRRHSASECSLDSDLIRGKQRYWAAHGLREAMLCLTSRAPQRMIDEDRAIRRLQISESKRLGKRK